MEDTASRAIAIVGLGALLPDAASAPAFWENVKAGRYSISEVTKERWDPDPHAPDKTYSKIGGFVRSYGMGPHELEARDRDGPLGPADQNAEAARSELESAFGGRSLRLFPHDGRPEGFAFVGDVFSELSGFDGAPESMRRLQLEYGAEIGRAVVNFRGPIAFVVVSRYHGGAFVVFSKALNANLEVAALEGSCASVIGGAPAAAVVFAREVDGRTRKDPRVTALETELAAAPEAEKRRLRGRLGEVSRSVRSEKLGDVAEEFDRIHGVERALRVGSLDRIVPPGELRPYLIDAIERGMAREQARDGDRSTGRRNVSPVLPATLREVPEGDDWLAPSERASVGGS